jgi:CheY-like chemotaxis protein
MMTWKDNEVALISEVNQALKGERVLVVDDEAFIAIVIEEMLREAGCEVVSASTTTYALERASVEWLSAALLDVHLGNNTSETVADMLASRSIPFIFYSGEALPTSIRDKHPSIPLLHKPVSLSVVMEALQKLIRH